MTSFRDRVNSHLPILLQLISTISLVTIALTAICGSSSLKKLSESHSPSLEQVTHNSHDHN